MTPVDPKVRGAVGVGADGARCFLRPAAVVAEGKPATWRLCKHFATALLSPRPQDEYLALLGALGGLVGLALASTGENTD